MSLKVYVDFLSQPSRAVTLFLRMNNISHEMKHVSLFRGENKSPDYVQKIHPFGKVPAIDDDGFVVFESIAILRYLSRKYDVPDHWYPKDVKLQARVDEFLEWHHIGARTAISMHFMAAFLKPFVAGKPPDESTIMFWKSRMEIALDEIENVWLERSPYLGGSKISIADLIGLCELDQPRMARYNPARGRPKISEWLARVRRELQPHYDAVIADLVNIIDQCKL